MPRRRGTASPAQGLRAKLGPTLARHGSGLRSAGYRPPRVPKPSVPTLKPTMPTASNIFQGLPKGSVAKHLSQLSRTTDFLRKKTGGSF